MKILSIETSCDETAISIIEANGTAESPSFKVLGNALYSQIETHKQYGGVFPALAKREHALNIVPLLVSALKEADMHIERTVAYEIPFSKKSELEHLLEREENLAKNLLGLISTIEKPHIDAIAVTQGPGLEPALWVGINFAKAINIIWNVPVIPTNHMEGHIVSVLSSQNTHIEFPAIALLISGGHTELVTMSAWGEYSVIGSTKDDAVGEAFDKVARMLKLPYPGGPEISKLAKTYRESGKPNPFKFPRPMLHSGDFDFSFSGLKTSVLYTIQKLPEITEEIKQQISMAFEDAAVEVLTAKSAEAIEQFGAKTLIVGGGVSANNEIRNSLLNLKNKFPDLDVRVPEKTISTDNALMIAIAGYMRLLRGHKSRTDFKALGTMPIEQ